VAYSATTTVRNESTLSPVLGTSRAKTVTVEESAPAFETGQSKLLIRRLWVRVPPPELQMNDTLLIPCLDPRV
jgi:hypothetical protein